jgi:alginate O-acetyltransferase complex protein AlgI
MLFCSNAFLVFFLVVFTLYWVTPWKQARIWLLTIASFYFYASWNGKLALLIFSSTIMDYFVARAMEETNVPRRRTLFLVVSLAANLGVLFTFKYANFFLHSLEQALQAVGGTASLPMLKVFLPIGISFYTFEAINYTVDVYRRRVPAEKNLAHFVLFITFFPHLVAGPIVRARDFLPQIQRTKRWDWARLQLGAQFILMGLFKKLAIADRMCMFADPVFQNPGQYSTYATWAAMIAYTLQIYCDFSGYTDMAIGTAHMLGYKLARNFNMPYLATNISEFWHRWHISLSTWLRDYLFIPLGGSQGTPLNTNRNLMITMMLGGLWHGANWTFVVWGTLHGMLLIGHRGVREVCERVSLLERMLCSIPGTAVRIGATLLSVMLLWVFFRAQTFTQAAVFIEHLFLPNSGLGCPMPDAGLWYTVLLVVICHILGYYDVVKRWLVRMPAPALGFSYAVILAITLLLSPDSGKAFIYFQF